MLPVRHKVVLMLRPHWRKWISQSGLQYLGALILSTYCAPWAGRGIGCKSGEEGLWDNNEASSQECKGLCLSGKYEWVMGKGQEECSVINKKQRETWGYEHEGQLCPDLGVLQLYKTPHWLLFLDTPSPSGHRTQWRDNAKKCTRMCKRLEVLEWIGN